jgi:hypothetical protein
MAKNACSPAVLRRPRWDLLEVDPRDHWNSPVESLRGERTDEDVSENDMLSLISIGDHSAREVVITRDSRDAFYVEGRSTAMVTTTINHFLLSHLSPSSS